MIPSPPETRASLIVRLRDAADVAAWDEFVAIYGPLVHRLAMRQGLQAVDAEDVVQQVFAAVAQSVHQWLERPQQNRFRGWLLTIARNIAIKTLTRRPQGGVGLGGDPGLKELAARECDWSSHFDLEYRREVYRWAAEQVQNTVSPSTWTAFQLTHIEGVSIAVAAERLNMTVGNIYIARLQLPDLSTPAILSRGGWTATGTMQLQFRKRRRIPSRNTLLPKRSANFAKSRNAKALSSPP